MIQPPASDRVETLRLAGNEILRPPDVRNAGTAFFLDTSSSSASISMQTTVLVTFQALLSVLDSLEDCRWRLVHK
jgi:hypothetical protein